MSHTNTSKDFNMVNSNQGVINGLDNDNNDTSTVLDHTNNILHSPSVQPATSST